MSIVALFSAVDVPFFLANISKIFHGAWFPLAIGGVFFLVMLTWARGRWILADQLYRIMPPMHQFIADLSTNPMRRIEGDAVFLTGSPTVVPVALAKNVKHNRGLHSRTVLLHFRMEEVPRVPNLEKIRTEKLGGGFYRLTASYGFMEDPKLETVLALAKGQGLDLNPENTSFFIGRESLVIAEKNAMARWRANLFLFMSRNAADATVFFHIPPEQVIEVGVRLSI